MKDELKLTQNALRVQLSLGEDSIRQFKVDVHNAESLASEMAIEKKSQMKNPSEHDEENPENS